MTTDEHTLLNIPPPQRLIHVHTSDRELGKVHTPDLAVHAGPYSFATALAEHGMSGDWAKFGLLGPVDVGKSTACLDDRQPAGVVLTNGPGNFSNRPHKSFKFSPDQRSLIPQSRAMGCGLPVVAAAKVASPERAVVCSAGSGDFQMNCQEPGTATQASTQPLVPNPTNGTHGTIRMHHERNSPEHVSGTLPGNPDFVMFAKPCGCHAERVEATDEFEATFEMAIASKADTVLELNSRIRKTATGPKV